MPQDFDVRIQDEVYIGQNNKFPAHLLPPGVFQLIQNAFIDDNRIFKRGGTSLVAAALGSQIILGGSDYEPGGGIKEIVVNFNGAANAQLYKWTGSGSFSAIGSANLTKDTYMNFTQASNYLFGFNGVEVVDYDGTTVTRNRAGVPKGSFAFWFHNYMFIGGVTSAPNRLYWSALGDPTTFDPADYVDINANDGDVLTGLNILNDELIVFKLYSIWAITGWSGTTFDVTTQAGQNTQARAGGIGTPSHASIVSVGRDLYYLSFSGNVPSIRSLNQTVFAKTIDKGVVSEEIEDTMLGLSKGSLTRAYGAYDGKYIYWSLPDGASTTNDLIIVLNPGQTYRTKYGEMHPWVIFDGVNAGGFITSTISGRSRLYVFDSTAVGKVYLFNDTSVYSDDGTAIVMDVKTRDFMGDSARQSKYKYLYFKYQTGSAGTLLVNSRIDQAQDFSLQESVDLSGNSPGLGPTGTFTLGTSILGGSMITQNRVTFQHLTGSLLGVQFKESTANSCELYDMQIYGMKKGFRNN